jgi:hypothetical protein
MAIVGLTVVNSTFVILLGISVPKAFGIGLTFFKYRHIAKALAVSGKQKISSSYSEQISRHIKR